MTQNNIPTLHWAHFSSIFYSYPYIVQICSVFAILTLMYAHFPVFSIIRFLPYMEHISHVFMVPQVF